MSTCPVCGHYWAWHDDSGCRVTTSATNCTCTERTTMTDKTPPYVIDFDQIKPGQTIEREWTFMGVRFRAEGVAHRLSPVGQWLTAGGGVIADSTDGTDVLRVLAEPPKPALPTTPGTVIRCTLNGKSSTLVRDDDGDWFGTHGNGLDLARDTSAAFKITDWTVVYDPTAPEPEPGPVTVLEVTEDDFEASPCEELCPRRGYGCTRSKGHDGLHIATTSRGVCAYWGEVQP